jgi:hypothetical protein
MNLLFAPALLLATGRMPPADRAYTLTMTTTVITQLLRQQLFTDSGRAYPCRNNPACSSWGEQLAASRPVVTVDGPRVALSVHVSGTYPINQYFAPEIAGDLTVSAVPVVDQGLVHVTQAQVTASPNSDMTFRAFIGAFHANMEQLLNQRGVFDLASYLALASRNPNLPPPRIPGLTCLDAAQIAIQAIGTQSDPAAVTAAITVSGDHPSPQRQPPAC